MNITNRDREVAHTYPGILSQTECTIARNKESAGGRVRSIKDALTKIPYKEPYYSEILRCRQWREYEIQYGLDDSQSNAQKKTLPVVYIGGVYSGKHTKDDIKIHSHFITLDIDEKDNPGLTPDQMKQIVRHLPFVLYAGLSVRGRGIFTLVPLPNDSEDDVRFRGYFDALSEALRGAGLVVDKACSNRNRARFLSFDDRPYVNENAEIWQKCQEPVGPVDPPLFADEMDDRKARNKKRVDLIIGTAEAFNIDIAPTPKDWFIIGRALANEFGEEGRPFFLRISDLWSRVTGKQHKEDPDKKYTLCLTYPGNTTSIGCFFKRASIAGIRVK